MVYLCIAKNCNNSKIATKNEDCKMFKIPKDFPRYKEWLHNCGRDDLLDKSIDTLNKYYTVCNVHFKTNMFSNPEKSRLLPNAVPTKICNFSGISMLKEYEIQNSTASSSSTQTPQLLFIHTPMKNKLEDEVKFVKQKCAELQKQVKFLNEQVSNLNSVNHFYEMCDIYLSPNLSLIVKNFVNLAQKKPQRYCCTKELKRTKTKKT
ncbi:52 kDa repressor of the inhibitor of the protein kinase-like [Daktulosphaira vitifoliae]|uniref:52 kDa repressor of the inhibitor of the protein kinase-like n=1 Tax=Daktulosphaira vitifoliae TaxID=58002 RepID=UPI0021A9DC63|nr:52 kDa repressor of the inhibitor of the protein kinase-like [Daktulosphaira vitifoliae]